MKDAEGNLLVDAFREVYVLSKSTVIEMYGKQAGFNSLASVRAYIWCQKHEVRRLPPCDDKLETWSAEHSQAVKKYQSWKLTADAKVEDA